MERQTDNDTVPDAAPLAPCLRAFVGREGASTSGRARGWPKLCRTERPLLQLGYRASEAALGRC